MDKDNNYSNRNPAKDYFKLHHQIFAFAKKHTDMIHINHIALYAWIVQKNNELFWEPIFGLPTSEAMRIVGIKDPRYYRRTLYELEEMGFIKIVEKSTNQHRANQISLLIREEEDMDVEPKVSDFDRISEEMRSKYQENPWPDPASNETLKEDALNSNGNLKSEREDDGDIQVEPMPSHYDEDEDLDYLKNQEPVKGDD